MKQNLNSKTSAGLQSLEQSELCHVEGGNPALVGVALGLAVIASVEFYNNHANVRLMDRARATVSSSSR